MALSVQDVLSVAMLSQVAYQEGTKSLSDRLSEKFGTAWSALSAPNSNGHGYYANGNAAGFAAVSSDENTLALVFRGTDDPDFLQDLLNGGFQQNEHYDLLTDLIDFALAYAQTHNISKVIVTGHSLGGAMAEYFSTQASQNPLTAGLEFSIATFGSPGIPITSTGNGLPQDVLSIQHANDPVATVPRQELGLVFNGNVESVSLPMDGGASFLERISIDHSMERYLETAQIICASPSADIIVSGVWNGDVIVGRQGLVDVLAGDSSGEIILGGSGNDVLSGGGADDILDGGDGLGDTAIFRLASGFYDLARYGTTVVVTAKAGVPQAADGTDTLYNVERLRFTDTFVDVLSLPDLSGGTVGGGDVSDGGTSPNGGPSGNESTTSTTPAAGEVIVGNGGNNYLYGTSGADTFQGNGGDDVLTGYSGQDTFDGGAGSDTVDYSYNPSDVNGNVNLATGTASFPGYYTELLTSIENVWMGAGNDTVAGDANNNDLRGGPGNDRLNGGLGNDIIYGDWKYSDQGGIDTAVLSYTLGNGYTVSGTANALHIVGAQGDDWYYNIENFELGDGSTVSAHDLLSYSPIPSGAHAIDRVSVAMDGAQGNNLSIESAVSADGRFIVFYSEASNLVAGDTNNASDVFLANLATGALSRISVAANGTQANSSSGIMGGGQGSISADGRYVAYYSLASNLTPGDTNGTFDIFVTDTSTGTVVRASTSSSGQQANSSSVQPFISENGRYAAFYSYASNLVSGDTNGTFDVFVKDLVTGATSRATTTSTGAQVVGQGSAFGGLPETTAWVSNDGRYVIFSSDATNLVPNDTNGAWDIFRKDLVGGQIERIASYGSNAPLGAGVAVNGGFSVSSDGRYVAFSSQSSDVVAGDTNNRVDVFVADLVTHSVQNVSVNASGAQGNGDSLDPSLSADGRYVVFGSSATNLIAGDTTSGRELFVKDLLTGSIERVTSGESYDGARSSVSGNGRFVVFESFASTLVPGDTNGTWDIFVVDRVANRDPVALDDAFSTNERSSVNGNVFLDNGNGPDTDADSDSLTVTAVNGSIANVGSQIALASGALLTVNPDGRFAYNPNGAFNALNGGQIGADSFTYTISDGQGHTDTATVNVTITGQDDGVVIAGGSGDETFTGTAQDDQIAGGGGNDAISGLAGFDWLQGDGGADTLNGGDGSDVLDGGTGADTMAGGQGHDIYIVDNAGDVVTDQAGQGIDTVQTSLSFFSLVTRPDVENLTFTNAATFNNGVGNAQANVLTGTSGSESLTGGGGNDTFNAGGGDDFLYIDRFDTSINAGLGFDAIFIQDNANFTLNVGATGAEWVYGWVGNNVLDASTAATGVTMVGEAGADQLIGSAFNDYLYIDSLDTLINAGAGNNDALFVYVGNGQVATDTTINMATANAEWALGGAGNDTFTNAGRNVSVTLSGGDGNDRLTGGLANDYLYGNAGVDTFVVTSNTQFDAILDFANGQDLINVQSLGLDATGLQAIINAGFDNGAGSTILNFGGGNQLFLFNVAKAQIDAGDFII